MVELIAVFAGDLDFDVDGFDLLKFQHGEWLMPFRQADLNDWQANFMGRSQSDITNSSSVPESATGVMLMLGVAVVLTGRVLTVPKPMR